MTPAEYDKLARKYQRRLEKLTASPPLITDPGYNVYIRHCALCNRLMNEYARRARTNK